MSTKQKYTREQAGRVWHELARVLEPVCERLAVAGSYRRGKDEVGDLEILYIGKVFDLVPAGEMFARPANAADAAIAELERDGILERRLSAEGRETYGPKNKLMVHRASGLPVDFFATVEACWHNYLVCRTGPAELNRAIATAAIATGWKWNPYGPGFSREQDGGQSPIMESERDVFNFVGLPYREPDER